MQTAYYTSKRDRQRLRNDMYNTSISSSMNNNTNTNNPDFQSLIRQLYKRSHPDILRANNPESAIINDSSMQILNSMLTTIKSFNEHPPALNMKIPFHIKNNKNNKLECKNLVLKTAGGYCKKQITASFEQFFIECDIGSKFVWNKEYFPIMSKEDFIEFEQKAKDDMIREEEHNKHG